MLIALAGLPGSGKSSTAKALGQIIGATVFCEPEESAWPSFLLNLDLYGSFTGLSWFRSIRASMLHDAQTASRAGKTSVIDSYYDVLIKHYIGTPPFSWLINQDDPYFDAAKLVAELDYMQLPRADAIVFLDIDEQTWGRFLSERARRYDHGVSMESFFSMQPLMQKACAQTAEDQGAKYVSVKQSWSSPEHTARVLMDALDF